MYDKRQGFWIITGGLPNPGPVEENQSCGRLLAADNAPMIVSFLYKTFIQPNVRTMAQQELVSRLADYFYGLREKLGDPAFPRRAIDWLAGFNQRQFVGAESRTMTVFALLREIAEKTKVDPGSRIAELEKRRAGIDAEIERIAERYGLASKPAQIRFRIRDRRLSIQGLTDLAVTACEFAALELPVERVFITENEINGLAFPDVRGSLVIFRFGLRPERALYDDLRYNRLGQRLRLEQERIPYRWVERALQLQIF